MVREDRGLGFKVWIVGSGFRVAGNKSYSRNGP